MVAEGVAQGGSWSRAPMKCWRNTSGWRLGSTGSKQGVSRKPPRSDRGCVMCELGHDSSVPREMGIDGIRIVTAFLAVPLPPTTHGLQAATATTLSAVCRAQAAITLSGLDMALMNDWPGGPAHARPW